MKQGWEIAEFENCLDKVTYTNKIQRKDFKEEGFYPIVSQEKDFINGYWDNEDDLFRVEKPVVIFGDHTQIIKFVDFDFVLGADGVKILKPQDKINPKYLYYFLQNVDLGSLGYARHYRLLKEINVAYPKSLPEQQRIVSILDEAFAAIAKAKANAEQNLKNAKELFESYLQGVFENGNWGFVKLSEMATDISDGDHMPPPKSEFGLPFITISNINKQTHKIDFSDTFKVPQKYYDGLKPNKKPINGDVLYTVTGSYGIPVLIEDDFKFCFQRHIGLIRPSKKLNSKLLYYWILSPQAFLQANETATGTAQKTVSLKSLRNFSFPNIPINQQQAIVRQLDSLQAETKRLEAIYQQKLLNLEELKKSVLQKAFAGELKFENVPVL